MAVDRFANTDVRQRRALGALSDQLSSFGDDGAATPRWVKVTLSFNDFRTNSTTKQVALYTLPAAWLVQGVKVKNSENFRGPGISTYAVSVGNATTPAKYASAFDVWQSPGSTIYQTTSILAGEDHDADTILYAQAVTDGSLSNATAGEVDVWLLISEAA